MFLFKFQNYFSKGKIECFSCGTYNISKAVFCKKCGSKLINKNFTNNKVNYNQNEEITNNIIVHKDILNYKCQNCRTENISQAIFCKNCGVIFKKTNDFIVDKNETIKDQTLPTNEKKYLSNNISLNNLTVFILIILLLISTYTNIYKSSQINFIQNFIPEKIIDNKNLIAQIKTIDNVGKIIMRGTGFIIGNNGYLATSYHVIEPFYSYYNNSIEADINGITYKSGKILITDKNIDVAIIKFNFNSQYKLNLADSYIPKLGENIFVIGNPMGFETTISNGIISAIREKNSYIQITAPVSHGSSGSPLFNSNGDVIGIITLSVTKGQNLNFALPIKILTETIINNNIKLE